MTIKCVDYWKTHIDPASLGAYHQLIEEGQIRIHRVTYSQETQGTVVEYYTAIPHEWILDELKKRSEEHGTVSNGHY